MPNSTIPPQAVALRRRAVRDAVATLQKAIDANQKTLETARKWQDREKAAYHLEGQREQMDELTKLLDLLNSDNPPAYLFDDE